jgi:hypothetical protein
MIVKREEEGLKNPYQLRILINIKISFLLEQSAVACGE